MIPSGRRDVETALARQDTGANPVARRARLPADYGLPKNSPLLSWLDVAERIRKALHYWLSTSGADGFPIARPIDGMWVANALYFGGGEQVRWMRNLRTNPNVCLTLEEAERAVIMEGAVAVETPDASLAALLAADADEKYEWAEGGAEQYQAETCVFRPRKVLAWTLLYQDATRFDFT